MYSFLKLTFLLSAVFILGSFGLTPTGVEARQVDNEISAHRHNRHGGHHNRHWNNWGGYGGGFYRYNTPYYYNNYYTPYYYNDSYYNDGFRVQFRVR